MPRPLFTLGKDPVPIVQEAGWVPGPVCTGQDSIPGPSSPQPVAIPTTLPGPWHRRTTLLVYYREHVHYIKLNMSSTCYKFHRHIRFIFVYTHCIFEHRITTQLVDGVYIQSRYMQLRFKINELLVLNCYCFDRNNLSYQYRARADLHAMLATTFLTFRYSSPFIIILPS